MGRRLPAPQIGERFGRLTIMDPERFARPARSQAALGITKGNRKPLCRCDCGTELQVLLHSLRVGETRSCGCLNREVNSAKAIARNLSHGLTHHPLYGTWHQMLNRCENPAYKQYKDYGGRGITVCDRWHDVQLFISDIAETLGPRPSGMTLDRTDNDQGYFPGNMRWATGREQRLNRRH